MNLNRTIGKDHHALHIKYITITYGGLSKVEDPPAILMLRRYRILDPQTGSTVPSDPNFFHILYAEVQKIESLREVNNFICICVILLEEKYS
jgi:hypothetical protein